MERANSHQLNEEGEVMSIVFVGIDLAKNVFALHGVNAAGAVQLRQPKVARAKLNEWVGALSPCTIGIEACSGAHHWARLFAAHGHTVKLMAPKLVAPYRMSGRRGKNDAADAAAICEAVQRPNMRFVPVKTIDQQSRLMVHRAAGGQPRDAGLEVGSRCAAHQPVGVGGVLPAPVRPHGLRPCAVTAAAHKLARLIYAMLTKGEEYPDQGQASYEERYRERVVANLNRRSQQLGLQGRADRAFADTGLKSVRRINYLEGVS